MTNLNNRVEAKQYYRNKVRHLMEEYQRSQHEEVIQKQQLKHNIMIQLMNKRKQLSPAQSPQAETENKSQTSQTADSEPQQAQFSAPNDIPPIAFNPAELKPNFGSSTNSVPKSQEVKREREEPRQIHPGQLTFNMKKRNKSLQEESNYKSPSEVPANKSEDLYEEEELNKSINRIAKYANKYFPGNLKDKLQNEKQAISDYQEEEELAVSDNFSRGNKSSYLDKYFAGKSYKQPEEKREEEQDEGEYRQEEEDGEGKEEERNEIQEDQTEQIVQDDDHRGVFLTMGEPESMTASQIPKNVAFDIPNNKAIDPDHLEDLRQQKIKDMERKRQTRIEEYRSNESHKKVAMPRGRSSQNLKHQKVEKEKQHKQPEVPKSTAIDRKSSNNHPPKMENRSEREPANKNLIPLDSHESHYQAKPNRPAKYAQKESYVQMEDTNRPVSPLRTPKTVASEHRPKSSHKGSNVFVGESQYARQKSASRIAEPKIEPKDRKYSFTRQSNKKLMVNAITYVCFPRELNRKDRERLIDVLDSSEHEFFVFLFKEYSRKIIKGIYILDSSQTRLERIYGDKAPLEVTADKVKEFYRFDSGSREFKKVDGCRSFSFIIHAIDHR